MIRQLLLSAAWAAVKRGDIRGGYRLTPAVLAGLVLASADGDTGAAGQMMLAAAKLLHEMQRQDAAPHQEGTSPHPPPPARTRPLSGRATPMRDAASRRLTWLCVLAGLPRDAWVTMTALEFRRAIQARAWS